MCVCLCVVHLHCSEQVSMFNVAKRYRNKIIISHRLASKIFGFVKPRDHTEMLAKAR